MHMEREPTTIPYARDDGVRRISWVAALGWAAIGMVSTPLVMFISLGAGCIGALVSSILPITVGAFIGRRPNSGPEIPVYTAGFGLVGSLPLIIVMIASQDWSDSVLSLSIYLSVMYPLTAGFGLFVVSYASALVFQRSPEPI